MIFTQCLNGKGWTMGEAPQTPLTIVTQNVTEISDTFFTVTFQTNKPVSGQIRYGTNYDFVNAHQLTSAQLILNETTQHEIKIDSLLPKTSYRYQIILKDPVSGEKAQSDYYLVTTL